jgi:alkanesulfonate monooxygenase SsuD/methylene tetrahydromethanopterin reductase-like flavin-dependent oxidoreductase (luciferase family)
LKSPFEIGIQLHLPTFRHFSLPDIVKLGQLAHAGGVSQIWVTDNLRSRHPYVVLTALASRVPVKLGSAVTVQYFRSPLDIADAVAAITELMEGREFGLGLARGNRYTPGLVNTVKPLAMLREVSQSIRELLDGEAVRFADYPVVASYFNLKPYCGGNGPRALAIGGACMDGVIFGGTFQAVVRAGHMERLMRIADDAAGQSGRAPLRKVAEIKLSVANDGRAARQFVKHSVARRIVALREEGYSDDDYRRLAINPEDITRLQKSEREDREFDPALVTDAMVDALFVTGSPDECREKMPHITTMAAQHGFGQLMFSELGPDLEQGLRLLCDKILPSL